MVMEVWTADQEWPIILPAEPPRDRPLVARNAEGDEVGRWRYEHGAWCVDDLWFWSALVARAMRNGWTLVSLPADLTEVGG